MRLMEIFARSFRKLASAKTVRSKPFEEMLAAGETLEGALAARLKCRSICFTDSSEAAMERCRRCVAAIERGQELYDHATAGLRGPAARNF